MITVVLILAFIAGIMVGNCHQPYYINIPQHYTPHFAQHKMHHKENTAQHKTNSEQSPSSASPNDNNAQVSGYIIEVEQAN